MYNKITDTKAILSTLKYVFYFNSEIQDLFILGNEPSEEDLNEEKDRANKHKQIMDSFEDETKIKMFIDLLEENPSTAYLTYLNQI